MTRRRIAETHGRPGASRLRPFLAAVLAAVAAVAAPAARGTAEPRPIDARVVWARADRVYIVATDSIALAPGDLITLRRGKKAIASGACVQVLARDLAAARLASGSLEREKHLDRLSILAERPPLAPLPALRIGCPARASLLFECRRPVPRPPLAAFRMDSLAENAYRMVRGADAVTAAPWPDTIIVRLFAEDADEEIALERGELDIAVFWPGEASSRLRTDPRWELAYGSRSRGVLVAGAGDPRAAEAALSPDLPAFAALNAELFRGDLAPWRGAAGPAPLATPPPAPRNLRFDVDPSCPGRTALERFLARATPAADAGALAIHLSYLDAPAGTPDLHGAPLFTVRCLLTFPRGLRAHVAALGGDAIADLLDCGPHAP